LAISVAIGYFFGESWLEKSSCFVKDSWNEL